MGYTLFFVLFVNALSGCSEDDPTPKQGVLLDAPVAGVAYEGTLGSSGITDGEGRFSYFEGEELSFRIGALTLGRARGAERLTPIDLAGSGGRVDAAAERIMRVLQTLDEDEDPANGIRIPAAARQAITRAVHVPAASNDEVLAAVRQVKPGAHLVEAERALDHFATTLTQRGIQLSAPAPATSSPVTLTLMHTNDTHSRMLPFTENNLSQGGVARRKTLIQQVRAEIDPGQTCKNQLLVDAGDFAQGTVFYNAWEGSESIMAMNDMGYDAATLGNHEFDLGPARLARALKGEPITIAGTSYTTERPRFKLVATNLDITKEPQLKGLVSKYAIVERCGHRYGILGIVTESLPTIASPGPNVKVLDYVQSVNSASALLRALGVNKVILLSHYGYSVDVAKAPQLSGVDVIVSAHDHRLLGETEYINAQAPGQGALSAGPYPTEVRDRDSNKVLIVSAYEWGRWLGRLEVTFDADGRVISGRNRSMFVGPNVAEDPELAAKVAQYKAPVDAFANVPVGTSAIHFSAARGSLTPSFTPGVRTAETLLGNLVADLMQEAARASDAAVAAFTNGGGLRADIPVGEVTFGTALSVLPFGNTLVVMDLTGAELIELMDASVSKIGGGGFLQLSRSLRMTYCTAATCPNALRPGGRVTALSVGGEPVVVSRTYRVATNNFIAAGGDGYDLLKNACNRSGNYCRDSGVLLLDLLVNRLRTSVPLTAQLEGRIERQ
ncbi:MAG: bifunctional UDP-sugar hydrolase/5'-nucleotidase [Burkholderiales bacterium]|nr:bifunctional UDP-sugar hydrolase/5'-nucleotidase [Burkholderiales bacterium]